MYKNSGLILFLVVAFTASTLYAEAEKEKEKALPRSGTLSTTSVSGVGGKNVALPWGDDDVVKGGSPISGSVSKVSGTDWIMKIFNNTKDTYSVDLEVVQLTDKNDRVKGDHFSYTLRGGQSAERKISAYANTKQCALNLLNWHNLSEKHKQKEATGTPGAAVEKKP